MCESLGTGDERLRDCGRGRGMMKMGDGEERRVWEITDKIIGCTMDSFIERKSGAVGDNQMEGGEWTLNKFGMGFGMGRGWKGTQNENCGQKQKMLVQHVGNERKTRSGLRNPKDRSRQNRLEVRVLTPFRRPTSFSILRPSKLHWQDWITDSLFLDASTYLYMRVCRSICRSVRS